MSKRDEIIEAMALEMRKIEFALPGAGGLKGRLRLANAVSVELATAALDAALRVMSEPSEEQREAGADVIYKMARVQHDDIASDCFTAMLLTLQSKP